MEASASLGSLNKPSVILVDVQLVIGHQFLLKCSAVKMTTVIEHSVSRSQERVHHARFGREAFLTIEVRIPSIELKS